MGAVKPYKTMAQTNFWHMLLSLNAICKIFQPCSTLPPQSACLLIFFLHFQERSAFGSLGWNSKPVIRESDLTSILDYCWRLSEAGSLDSVGKTVLIELQIVYLFLS